MDLPHPQVQELLDLRERRGKQQWLATWSRALAFQLRWDALTCKCARRHRSQCVHTLGVDTGYSHTSESLTKVAAKGLLSPARGEVRPAPRGGRAPRLAHAPRHGDGAEAR